jgi:hypothetical protein
VQVLAGVAAFAGCEREQLGRIAALGTEVHRGPGAVLQRAGRLVRQAMVVVDGVAAERPANGRERAVSAGHLVGAGALAAGPTVADSEVVAVTDVRVLVFGLPELRTVADLLASSEPRPVATDGLLARLRHRPRPRAAAPTWAGAAAPSPA